MQQATLGDSFFVEGIGVHSGRGCAVRVSPADEDVGINFLIDGETVAADYRSVSSATMCTQISGIEKGSVKTIEHLCAALYGAGISNAVIEVEGKEIPILDGSASKFVELIREVGVYRQNKARKILRILKNVEITEGDRYEKFEPFNSFSIKVTCDFSARGLMTFSENFDFSKNDFFKEIAPARTFGFESDVEFVRKNNLAKGASLENTVVYGNQGGVLNDGGLRFANESVRHKLLDVIGDMSLSRYWIHGKLTCFCPGHNLNNMMLKLLFASPENYEIL